MWLMAEMCVCMYVYVNEQDVVNIRDLNEDSIKVKKAPYSFSSTSQSVLLD